MGNLSDRVNEYRAATSLEQRYAAVEIIIQELGPELLGFACRNLKREIAEEIYQETLLVVARKLGQYNGDSDNSFRSWCYRILRNKIANCLREKQHEELDEFTEESLREAIDAGTKDISPGVREDLEYALTLLDTKKPDCRRVLWLHHILGWDIIEIAHAQQRLYDTVRMQLDRCLDLAESLMAKHP